MFKVQFLCSLVVTVISFISFLYGLVNHDYTLALIGGCSFVGWFHHTVSDYEAAKTIHNIAKKYGAL